MRNYYFCFSPMHMHIS